MAQQIQSVYTLIALHWYKNTLNTNPSSSIPWTPAWPPPFSCAAALHTLLSLSSLPTPSDPPPPLEPRVSRRPPPPPEPSLVCSLSLPTPSDPPMSPHSTRRRSSPASLRWHRCQRSFVSWRRRRRPCLTTACGGRCAWRTDPAMASTLKDSLIDGSASIYISYLGFSIRHLRRLPASLSKIHALHPRPPLPTVISTLRNPLLCLLLVDFVQTLIPFLFLVFWFVLRVRVLNHARVRSCRISMRWSAASRRWRSPPRSARCRPWSPRRCKVRNPFPPVLIFVDVGTWCRVIGKSTCICLWVDRLSLIELETDRGWFGFFN